MKSSCSITRRGFLLGAGAGLAAGAAGTWLGLRAAERSGLSAPSSKLQLPRSDDGMPGPYPGRVVEVNHPGSVNDSNVIYPEAVRDMVDRGMRELTGAEHSSEAWKRFFGPDDVVGIKVNPVGRRYRPTQTPAISSPALVVEVVQGLKQAGVRPHNIILFERYADQFRDAGYEALTREPPLDGVRWYASS